MRLNGTFITKFGSSGTGDGQFLGPTSLEINAGGNVYVIDQSRRIVQIFELIPTDATPPTASISLSLPSPLKVGNVTVTLTASEQLSTTPSLSFTPQGKSLIAISLSNPSGDKITWTGTMTISTNTGDGTATFSWSGIDLAGNVGTVITPGQTFVIDTTAPITTIGLSPVSPVPAGTVNVTLTASQQLSATSLSFTPQGKSMISVSLTNSGDNQTFTGSFSIDSNTGDGTAVFNWSGTDFAGNVGTQISPSTFTIDTLSPIGFIKINNNVNFTNSINISLNLSAQDCTTSASQMRFSEDGVSFSAFEPFSTSKSFTLSSGDGAKRVFVQFKDLAGNLSDPAVSNMINLDTTPAPSATITVVP